MDIKLHDIILDRHAAQPLPSSETVTLLLWIADAISQASAIFTGRDQLKVENLMAHAFMTACIEGMAEQSAGMHALNLEIGADAYAMVSSPIGLRNSYIRRYNPKTLADYLNVAIDIKVEEQTAQAASRSGAANETLSDLVEKLAEKHPRLGLSFGYIGNCDFGGRYDDRSWKVFAKLATPTCTGGCDVSFGGNPTSRLGHLMVDALNRLSGWCQEQEARLDRGEIRIVGSR